jgi:hypothetical protein
MGCKRLISYLKTHGFLNNCFECHGKVAKRRIGNYVRRRQK